MGGNCTRGAHGACLFADCQCSCHEDRTAFRWWRGAWIAVRWGWAQGQAERHEAIADRAREREARAKAQYRDLYPNPYAQS